MNDRTRLTGFFVIVAIGYSLLVMIAISLQPIEPSSLKHSDDLALQNLKKADWSNVDHQLLAQEIMAHWALWVGVFTAFGLVAVFGTLLEAIKTSRATTGILELEIFPFLTIELVGAAEGTIDDRPTFLRIRNDGKSVAKTTRIFRQWYFSADGSVPPVPRFDEEELRRLDREDPLSRLRGISIAIGSDMSSPLIATFGDQIGETNDKSKWLYFHGFVEFSSQDGSVKSRSGFCYVLAPSVSDRGFHVAFHSDNEDRWYYETL